MPVLNAINLFYGLGFLPQIAKGVTDNLTEVLVS